MPMTSDPDIICLKHCDKHIFVFSVPSHCPVCNQPFSQFKDFLPFTLPYPFVNATQSPCSVVLRSSSGDFLNDFQNSINLHIALTDSSGSIIEFDQPGLLCTAANHVNKTLWRQSLMILQVPESWYGEWDRTLRHVVESQRWDQKQYDDEHLNCYSFVLEFLRVLQYGDYSMFADDRSTFSNRFVVPKTTHAAKYITIFRRVQSMDSGLKMINECNENCEKSFDFKDPETCVL